MKRSEMVKVIEKAMRCWNGAYYNQSLESHILEYIEEAGMLPPERGIGEEDEWGYLQFENTWEPEE